VVAGWVASATLSRGLKAKSIKARSVPFSRGRGGVEAEGRGVRAGQQPAWSEAERGRARLRDWPAL
jgi:hypothetical protein